MAEYEQSQKIDVAADEVFAWLSDVDNLPKYLPPIKEAHIQGSTVEDKPGKRLYLRGEIPDRGEFENEGYLDVDQEAREMKWGAEVARDYSGWLTVAEDGDGSLATVHLHFGEQSVEGEIEEESNEDRHPLQEGLTQTLEFIRSQIEEGAGKVQPSSPTD